ncbi:hypothetical protein ACFVAV_31010 [Nocardia sp. NPDC057663]|uniref:hypothetical protein n=1 Tax=Nocardia sp. NPDC057663 TaxID=3346201 RepID=UPI00366D79D0
MAAVEVPGIETAECMGGRRFPHGPGSDLFVDALRVRLLEPDVTPARKSPSGWARPRQCLFGAGSNPALFGLAPLRNHQKGNRREVGVDGSRVVVAVMGRGPAIVRFWHVHQGITQFRSQGSRGNNSALVRASMLALSWAWVALNATVKRCAALMQAR